MLYWIVAPESIRCWPNMPRNRRDSGHTPDHRGMPPYGGVTMTNKPTIPLSKRLLYSDVFWAAVLLAPNLIGFLVFMLFPMVASFGLSFVQ